MMVPKKSLMLAGAALLFGAATNAQSQSGKVFARYNQPLKSATLDLSTGTITRGPAVTNRGAPTVTDFANNDLGGFVGVDTGNGFCEWIDAGVKGNVVGNASDLMNSVVFAYCSAMLTPGSGGPGGSVKLGYYEGYTLFGGAPTTGVASFTLTGLPGNSASSSFFGGFSCFFIRVIFGNLVCFADGPIGYSWKFLDNGTGTINPVGAVLAGTWPFLSCVVSCSGAILQVDGQGMTDAIDEYCPPGFLLATFTFGTTSGSFTSVSMAVEEVVDKTGTVTGFNSSTFPNPDGLTSNAAVVGANWTGTITHGITRTGGTYTIYFATAALLPPTGVATTPTSTWGTPKAGRMALIAFGSPPTVICSGTHAGSAGGPRACGGLVPKRLSLVCNTWFGQAVITGTVSAGLGGGVARLSSGIVGVVGTHF
jgi:hypothetical protein